MKVPTHLIAAWIGAAIGVFALAIVQGGRE